MKNKKKFVRRLIEAEIKGGFLNIPPKGIGLMPNSSGKSEKVKIKAVIDGERGTRQLSYNTKYRRVWKLKDKDFDFYKKLGAKPKDYIELSKIGSRKYKIKFYKKGNLDLSSQQKGNIVEDRIKELIIIQGQELLSIYKPVIDTEGIDFIIVKNGQYEQYLPVFIQVKGRLNKEKSLKFKIRTNKFTPHKNFYLVGVFFDLNDLDIKHILLIPSKNLVKEATVVKHKSGESYSVVVSLTEKSKGKWKKYLIDMEKSDLGSELLGILEKQKVSK